MSYGVLYYLVAGEGGGRSGQHALQFPVSLMSLRRRWKGGVYVACGDEWAVKICEAIRDEEGDVNLIWGYHPKPQDARCYGLKTNAQDWSPFNNTIFLDTDTLVVGAFDELWPLADEIVLTAFSDWKSTDRRIRKRCEPWRPYVGDLLETSASPSIPAINTGVFGFTYKTEAFAPWRDLCRKQPNLFIGDESCLQAIAGNITCRFVDDRYNLSPKLGLHKEDPRIHHGHGRKAFTHPRGREIWLPYLRECVESNFGNIRDWGKRYAPQCISLAADCPAMVEVLSGI